MGAFKQWPKEYPSKGTVDSNELMLKQVDSIDNSIGYISLATLGEQRLAPSRANVRIAQLVNARYQPVFPTKESIVAAVSGSGHNQRFSNTSFTYEMITSKDLSLINVDADNAYPLCYYTYLCFQSTQNTTDTQAGEAIYEFVQHVHKRLIDVKDKMGDPSPDNLFSFVSVPESLVSCANNFIEGHLMCLKEGTFSTIQCLFRSTDPALYVTIAVLCTLMVILIIGIIIILGGFFTYRLYAKRERDRELVTHDLKESLLEKSSASFFWLYI
jgi:hypothetical protein